MRKYTYHVFKNTVYCITKYAGKTVKGIAKCDTSVDTFDETTGRTLAQLRCDKKIAQMSLNRAERALATAEDALAIAFENVHYKTDKYEAAAKSVSEISRQLEEFENKLING